MNFRSANVKITRSRLPWKKQCIQVDGVAAFDAKKSYRLISSVTTVSELQTDKAVIRIEQPRYYKSIYHVYTQGHDYTISRLSHWQWECRSKQNVYMISRIGGIKCIISHEGRQMAIMSLNTNLPFTEDRNTYIRVNEQRHLNVSIAAALVVKPFGISLDTLTLNNNKLVTIPKLELAR